MSLSREAASNSGRSIEMFYVLAAGGIDRQRIKL